MVCLLLQASLAEARQRLKELNDLSDELSLIKKATDDGFPEISERAMALGIEDHPPERPQRGAVEPINADLVWTLRVLSVPVLFAHVP